MKTSIKNLLLFPSTIFAAQVKYMYTLALLQQKQSLCLLYPDKNTYYKLILLQ